MLFVLIILAGADTGGSVAKPVVAFVVTADVSGAEPRAEKHYRHQRNYDPGPSHAGGRLHRIARDAVQAMDSRANVVSIGDGSDVAVWPAIC
jgi:hypothetical protein